jgi:putative hydrolase of the HAD superfamily
VFTTSPFDAFNSYELEAGLPRDLIRSINATNPDSNAWARLERSDIDVHEFATAFESEASLLGHVVDGRRVLACLSGDVIPEMVGALDRIRERMKVGCITNNVRAVGEGPGMSRTAEQAELVADIMRRFEVIVESSRVGVRKPDPAIYEMACKELGVEPPECIYVDDLGVNCKPAAAMGMLAIKATGVEQTLDALEAAVGFSVR